MVNVLCVHDDQKVLEPMLSVLSENAEVKLIKAGSAKFGLERVGFQEIDVVISAENLPDMDGVKFIEQLTKANPFVSCFMLSDLEHDVFHEVTEGLGVLMQLPNTPAPDDAHRIMQKLNDISRIMAA